MNVGAVERVGPVERAAVMRGPADVTPALGVGGAAHLEEHSSGKNDPGQDRGMESEEAESANPEECPAGEESTQPALSCHKVDLFA